MWNGGAVIWSAGGYTDITAATLSDCLSLRSTAELAAGRPVIAHLQNTYGAATATSHTEPGHQLRNTGRAGSGWNAVLYPAHRHEQHLRALGVHRGRAATDADPNNLMESDFYALDPARVTDGSAICVTRLLDGTLWTANSPLKVAG
jgi:hypothetical protein